MLFAMLNPWLLAFCISGESSVEGVTFSSSTCFSSFLLRQQLSLSQQPFFSSSVSFDVKDTTCLIAFFARCCCLGGIFGSNSGGKNVKGSSSLQKQMRPHILLIQMTMLIVHVHSSVHNDWNVWLLYIAIWCYTYISWVESCNWKLKIEIIVQYHNTLLCSEL